MLLRYSQLHTTTYRAFLSALIALAGALAPVGSPVSAQEPNVAVEILTPSDNALYAFHAGDDRLFIVERAGVIRIYTEGDGLLPTPFLDISHLVAAPEGEKGMYAMAFHPNYATNGYFFVSYLSEASLGYDSIIARYEVSGDPNVADPSSEAVLIVLDQPDVTHNGGQIAFSPVDGYLYISFADGACCNDGICAGQRDDTWLSKLLRLDVDQSVNQPPYYGIPPDNPFIGANDPGDLVLDEIWAKGLRNPFHFSFDRLTGDLFIGDVGEVDVEEIDYQPASSTGGENYGWKVMEGNICKHPNPTGCPEPPPGCFDPAYTEPIHTYTHAESGCAVIGGFRYRGSAIPSLYGWYIFGDNCAGTVWAIEELGPGQWGNVRELFSLSRVFTFGEDVNGELYVADQSNVYRLVDGTGRKEQSALQQICINRMNGGGAGIVRKRSRLNELCVKFAARQWLHRLGLPPGSQTLRDCLDLDPRGRVQRNITALMTLEARSCRNPSQPEQVPDFAYTSAASVGAAGLRGATRLTEALYGTNPDDAIVSAGTDPGGATCQANAHLATHRIADALWRRALEGKKGHLKGRWGLKANLGSELGERVLEHVDADGLGRIAGAVGVLDGVLNGSCGGLPLDQLFPGTCASPGVTPAQLRDCVHERARCYFCRSFESFDGLALDCDGFDDGNALNGSCPSEAELLCGAPGSGVHWDAASVDCPLLSQYRLFADPDDPTADPNSGGVPYDLTTPLFSDYAQKYRFVFLPPGTQATYHADDPFDFPVGTIISKTFSFAYDLRDLDLGEEVIETRLLIHRELGWEGLAYVWDPGTSEFVLTPGGASHEVSWIDISGTPRSTTYQVPSAIQCGSCHFGSGDDPIGPKARLLNRDLDYPLGSANQIDHWASLGILAGAPPSSSAPRLPFWDDPLDGTLQDRARAYLESNCAHCHNPDGRAGFTGLTLWHDQPLNASYGICDPANDGDGSSGLTYGIVPGAPEDSVLLYRMSSAVPPVRMPELSKSVVHDEGVSLVDDWIAGLGGSCP